MALLGSQDRSRWCLQTDKKEKTVKMKATEAKVMLAGLRGPEAEDSDTVDI